MSSFLEAEVSSVSQKALASFFKRRVFRSDSGYAVLGVAFSPKKVYMRNDWRKGKRAYVALHVPENKTFKESAHVEAYIMEVYTRWEERGRYYLYVDGLSERWLLSPNDSETDCPESILRLLTPTDNEHALQWRAKCRANARCNPA